MGASAPGVWLDQVVTQANAARQQVVDAESFTDNYSRFIPEPIVRLMAWEKSYREQLEAKGGESTQELKTSIRRHAAEAATPIIASFAETGILQPEKLKVTDLQLPDFNAGTSAYVTVEAQYSYTFFAAVFQKKRLCCAKKSDGTRLDRRMNMWAWWMVGMMLALAFATDIRKQIIPNWLTAAGIGAGLLGHGMAQGGYGLAFSAAGLACGFIPMLLLYAVGGVGAGDVKLFGALGAMTGAVFTLYAMVASLFFAGLIA